MKKAIKALMLGAISSLAVGGSILGASLNAEAHDPSEVKASSPYTLSMSKGLTWSTGNTYTATTSAGAPFSFNAYSYTTSTSYFGYLSSGGTIANSTRINGITSLTITLTSGALTVNKGWTPYGSDITYETTGTAITGTSPVSVTMDNDYFEIVATADSVIASVSIDYTCAAITSVSNFRLTIAAPSVNSGTAVYDSNYVWINTNILDSGTWSNYLMTEDTDGTWYYDFSNVAVLSSGYTFTLVLCDSNTTFTWNDSYKSSNYSSYGVAVYAGQTSLTESTVPAFSSQPLAISSTYSLTLTINMTGGPTSWGNMQIVYNYDNSTSNYTWDGEFAWATASSYSRTISSLNSSSDLYFKVYMYTDSTDHYIGGADGANFTITPSGSSDKSATITFTYDSSSSAIVGTQS